MWYDQDPNKHKLYRLTPPGSPKLSTGNTGSNTGTGKSDFTVKGFFDSKSHRLVTQEEYEELSAKDFSIRPLSTKEKSPNNFILMIKGEMKIYQWVGKWIKPAS